MLPILAAINAVDAADKLATGAMALWKNLIASKAEAKSEASGTSGTFADALATHGVVSGGPKAENGAGSVGVNAGGPGLSSRILNQLT